MKRMDDISQKVWNYVESHEMLKQGDRVLLGVSGGADSVCLLFLLREMQARLSLSLRVLHVHHGIRREADDDAAFVRALCEKLGIPYDQENVNVPALAKTLGISEEEAGRKARYQAFEERALAWDRDLEASNNGVVASGQPVKVALAHHAGDCAETFLFHLFRGTGLKGLVGIPPVRPLGDQGAVIIRPLLCLEREEIEEYLKEQGISYCSDRTNEEDEYARNRIRHHVLPYAEAEIHEGAIRHVNQAAEMLKEAEEYLAKETQGAMERCVEKERRGDCIVASKFISEPVILQKRMLMELLRELSPEHKDLGTVHVEAVRKLFSKETGKSICLPFGIKAIREYERIWLVREAPDALQGEETIDLSNLGEAPITAEFDGKTFEFQKLVYKNSDAIPEKTYTKWFDYDKIDNTLSIRTRRTGDFFLIRNAEGKAVRKMLKDYFITEKVPQSERERLPLLVSGSHVLWALGLRISESFKVSKDTKTVLQVKLTEEKNHGGAY